MGAKGMGWDESKYKEHFPEQLVKMFSEGKDREDFCSYASISYNTFDMWLKKHPEFKSAYEVAKVKAKQWYTRVARDHLIEEPEGPKLNTKLWSMLMRNRFELTEHRKIKSEALAKAKTHADRMKAIMNELATGNLTAAEAQALCKLVETGVSVEANTELVKRLEQIEAAQKSGVIDSDFKEA